LARPGKLAINIATSDWAFVFMASLKLVFGFALFVALALVGLRVIPPYFANYEFEDSIKTEALQATYTTRTEDDIRETVIKQAQKYDIELTPKQVKVSRVGGFGSGSLNIEADYSVPIDLPGYSTTLEFHPSTKNKGVY
jgi:hypothetical protein